ncbi:hypothetical protein GALMADRAFT_248864 [Galerina marginata CBS 339.88]|uniref:Uncharacterized protein n=1 Tax=Galerina marginata (strain CBS 339.88) TaxID=685588 RepID=A0A067T535_GALM3|nr:hypothetical protein GALMADRAFT_248864 [Galerina marginata CBS 339.88]
MVNFPAPVGGTALPADFAPSIVFAVLYALLLPLMLYRLYKRRSRTTLLIGTITFSVERVVIFSLRAVQSRNEARRFSHGLVTYMQVSFALGFIGIANDLVNIVRCILINPTYGSDMYYQSPAAKTKGGVFTPPPEGTPDQPRLRFWLRRFSDFLGLAFLAATVPGTIANSTYGKVFDNQQNADKTAKYRFVSTGVALGMCAMLIGVIAWIRRKFPRTSRRGATIICLVSTLMAVVAIYRLSVMNIKATTLTVQTSLDKPGAKAAFYIFHALPEWLAILILLASNVRKLFGTGLAGDFRGRDLNKRELKKREAKLAKEKEKGASEADGATDNIPLKEKNASVLVSNLV